MRSVLLLSLVAVTAVSAAQIAPGIYLPDSSTWNASTNPNGKRMLKYDHVGTFQNNVVGPNNVNFTTPIQAVANSNNTEFLVTDQVADNIQRYSATGTFLGVWAGGLDNIRGITRGQDGNYYAAVAAATASGGSRVQKFDANGVSLGNFTTNVTTPWGVTQLRSGDFLISSSATGATSEIRRFSSTGAFLGVFATGYSFSQQIHEAANGNILVSVFSSVTGGKQNGVYEFTSTGTELFRYNMDGARGVTELSNGKLMATAGTNIRIFDRFVFNGTDIAGFNGGSPTAASYRMIYNHPVPEPGTMAALGLGVAALIRRRRAKKA